MAIPAVLKMNNSDQLLNELQVEEVYSNGRASNFGLSRVIVNMSVRAPNFGRDENGLAAQQRGFYEGHQPSLLKICGTAPNFDRGQNGFAARQQGLGEQHGKIRWSGCRQCWKKH